jgi:hypothetical protein
MSSVLVTLEAFSVLILQNILKIGVQSPTRKPVINALNIHHNKNCSNLQRNNLYREYGTFRSYRTE